MLSNICDNLLNMITAMSRIFSQRQIIFTNKYTLCRVYERYLKSPRLLMYLITAVAEKLRLHVFVWLFLKILLWFREWVDSNPKTRNSLWFFLEQWLENSCIASFHVYPQLCCFTHSKNPKQLEVSAQSHVLEFETAQTLSHWSCRHRSEPGQDLGSLGLYKYLKFIVCVFPCCW